MPFTGSFTIAASATLGVVVLTDASSGSDPNLTNRLVTLYKADNSILAQYNWDIGQTTLNLSDFIKDYALNVKVEYQSDLELANSVYMAEQLFAYTKYGWNEYAQMTRLETSKPDIISDKAYYDYKQALEVEITGAEIAISIIMEDRFASQRCIDRYQYLFNNKNLFY